LDQPLFAPAPCRRRTECPIHLCLRIWEDGSDFGERQAELRARTKRSAKVGWRGCLDPPALGTCQKRPIEGGRTVRLTVRTAEVNRMRRTCWTIMTASVVGALSAAASAAPPAAGMPEGQPGCGEARYPFDAPEPWLHGYFQETPAYGGYRAFRPYNYKHVFVQSQIAAGWGAPATMPYSHLTSHTSSQK
jgi:hypothetical protein